MTTETTEDLGVDQTTEGTDSTEGDDSDFDAGFDGKEQTTTPVATESGEALAEDAPAPTAQAEPEPAPKLAQITEDQFKALMAKADEVDQIRSDSKRQIDTLAGHLGGMKQLVEGLKQQRATLTPGQLKRVSAEFPDLGKLLEEDLGELAGTQSHAVDPAEIDRRAQAIVAQELAKAEVKGEIKFLARQHKDWVDVVKGQEFIDWSRTLSPDDQTKLMGNDGEFIADRITDFKADKAAKAKAAQEAADKAKSQKPSTNRQQRLEAAVPPKGAGGHAPAPAEEDEFEVGFKTG